MISTTDRSWRCIISCMLSLFFSVYSEFMLVASLFSWLRYQNGPVRIFIIRTWSIILYGPTSRVHRTTNKRVRCSFVCIGPRYSSVFWCRWKILIIWIPTMKKFHKNSVTKIRKLSPILLKTFKNLVLKSSRRLSMTVAIEVLSGINWLYQTVLLNVQLWSSFIP